MPKLKLHSKIGRKLFLLSTLTIFVIVGVNFSLKWLKQVTFVPIEVVTLTDKLQYADPVAIKASVSKHLKPGFFSLDLAAIRADLKKVSWIADATVERCWPNMVKLRVLERQPLAIWQGKGVVDTEGKLFFPTPMVSLPGLPEFLGQPESVSAMVDMYFLILSTLKPIGLAVKSLELMPDRGWRTMLDNGITVILGQTEIEERLARFVWAYDSVVAKKQLDDNISVVDLRYTNGLTIG